MTQRFHLAFFSSVSLVALALASGCAAPSPTESVGVRADEMTADWLSATVGADEKAILALVNDKSMSVDEYVQICHFSLAESAAIVDYRQGDEPADSSDDQVFDNLAELDALPFTNAPFWITAAACARAHYKGGPTGICASGTSTVQQSALALEFVLDGSGSMYDQAKWSSALGALTAVFEAQAQKNDPQTGMGLITFSDDKDPNNQVALDAIAYPTAIDVGVAPVDATHLAALKARVAGTNPGGATPLYEAITGAYGYLNGLALTGSLTDATKAIVVLTDGVPTDKGPDLLTFVGAHAADAQLFAVGVGNLGNTLDYDPAYLGSLAVQGGTRASTACNPAELLTVANMCHFQITPNAQPVNQLQTELSAALAKIRHDIAACDIGLQALGTGAIDPNVATVLLDDGNGTSTAIANDAANGWSFDDATAPTKILIRGNACANLRADANRKVRVEVGCK